ncbi:MAG: hypothetical protein Q9212_004758 [Teloschistes hypoglaucus]
MKASARRRNIKLRIRCTGGSPPGATNRTKPCNHCNHLRKDCVFPEEDGRKRPRAAIPDTSEPPQRNTPTSDETTSVDDSLTPQSAVHDVNRLTIGAGQHARGRPGAPEEKPRHRPSQDDQAKDSYTTIHYYRELGPTALAPGHKQISIKIQQQQHYGIAPKDTGATTRKSFARGQPLPMVMEDASLGGLPPLFDSETSLPVQEVLSDLLDAFFTFCADNFCFLNRLCLDQLLARGEASIFLICSMAALSSRFCSPAKFAKYLPPKDDGSLRQGWELSDPFLERAKGLLLPLLGIPSCDVISGLVLLSLAEFGNNSEAGMWMFTGMALRMAQEIGLHRERSSRGTSISQSPTNVGTGEQPMLSLPRDSNANVVDLDTFEKSAQVVLFWCCYSMDVNLCNGTGRVPCIKRHEISIRLPEDRDMAVIRAGPGGTMKPLKPEVYPHYANLMLSYARSIDFLNTESSEVQGRAPIDDARRRERVGELTQELTEKYQSIPREVKFGAIYYQAAVRSGQAAPYLLLHHQYHLQIAFLTQEAMVGEESSSRPVEGTVTEDGRLDLPKDKQERESDKRKSNESLYRSSIRSITDMLTFAKHIDDRALLATFYLNQSFFHAACAYIRDMLQYNGELRLPEEAKPKTFPIPSQTAPSLVDPFQDYSQYPKNLIPPTGSSAATESTSSYLTLIAKANYQFLREAIRVVAQYYSGAGWVDAVLDQREVGLRDVDLSIVSDNISSYIRLHDLRSRTAQSQHVPEFPPLPSSSNDLPTMSSEDYSTAWADLASGFMSDDPMVLDFDPQAFFNDYMFTGQTLFSGSYMGDWVGNATKKGWLTSIFELGAWFGCLYSGFLAEIFSRKYAILMNVCIFVVGVIIQCVTVAGGASCLIAGRFVTGLAIGAISVNVPNYNAEVAPPEVRGSLVALQQLAITAGIMVSFWIDYGTNNIGGTGKTQSDAAWLLPICLQLIPGIALGIGLLFMPFSPRWLVHHGREAEARKVLSNLRGLAQDHPLIELEFLEIKAQSIFEKRSTAEKWPHLVELTPWNTFKLQFVAIGSLFTTKAMFRRTTVATVTMFFQQFTGINAVLYYAPSIFEALGTSSNTTSLLATGVVGVAMFLATIPAVLYIDKLGRKPVMLAGSTGMFICHITIAVIFGKNEHQWATHKAAGWAASVMLWLFVVNFGYSWGPCAWVLIAEVWPLSNRAYGIALGASSNWMSNFIVGQITPDMLKRITYGTFIFFAAMTAGGAVFLWWYVPETKRLTLEEMDVVFGSVGVARADNERMRAINREIGLDNALRRLGVGSHDRSDSSGDEQSRSPERVEGKI